MHRRLNDTELVEFVRLCVSEKQIKELFGEVEIKNIKHIQQMRDGAIDYVRNILNFFRVWNGLNDGTDIGIDKINAALITTTVKDTNFFYFKFKSYLAPLEKACAMAYQTSIILEKEAKDKDDLIIAWSTKVNWINIVPAVVYCFYTDIDIDNVIQVNQKALTMYFSTLTAMKGGIHVETLEDYLDRNK